jgi:hypothetical protein
MTYNMTAADLKPGMTLVRVKPAPLSAVFTSDINETITAVTPFVDHGRDYIRVNTDTPYKTTYNLVPAREVNAEIGA